MNTYDINKIKLPNGDICNLRDQHVIITKTVQNTNIIHIEDAAEKPLKECKIDIQPVQDLHGYEHPWPAGGGKNKLNVELPIVLENASNIGNKDCVLPAGTYTYTSKTNVSAAYSFTVFNSSGTQLAIANTQGASSDNLSVTFTISEESAYIRCYYNAPCTITNIQIEQGSSFTGYVPYSNICPITGWTGAKVTRTGKNLFDQNRLAQLTGWVVEDGVFKGNSSAWESLGNMLGKSPETKQVTVSFDGYVNYENSRAGYIRFNYTDGTASYVEIIGRAWAHYVLTSASGKTISSVKLSFSNQRETWLKNVQVEYGSTATSYEPYSGTTYSITFPTEAGTVYGGSLDVTNGVLTVDRAIIDMGDMTWSSGYSGYYSVSPLVSKMDWTNANTKQTIYCSSYNWLPYSSTRPNGCIMCESSSHAVIVIDSRYDDAASFKAAVTGQTIVYPLATPITYQLTPQEITTLLGTNNIWADTGNISCTYYVESELNTELNNYIKNDQLPVASTSTAGIVQLNDTLDSTSVTQAATANALGEVYRKTGVINSVQETNLVHVEDAAEMPLKTLKVNLSSYQDLHGYDHPWPAGGGKNLVSPTITSDTPRVSNVTVASGNEEITITETSESNYCCYGTFYNLKAGTYSFKYQATSSDSFAPIITLYKGTKNILNSVPANTHRTFTLSEDSKIEIRMFVSTTGNGVIGRTVRYFQMQLESGSTLSAWTPYSNICPIIGQTSVVAHRTGKNLLKPFARTSGIITRTSDGKIIVNGTSTSTQWLESGTTGPEHAITLPQGTYTFSGGLSQSLQIYGFYSYDNFTTRTEIWHDTGNGSTFTLTKPGKFYIQFQVSAGTYNNQSVFPQLELGSTATAYEPYIGHQTVEANLGKNLLQLKNGTHSLSGTGVTAIIDSNGITLSGTAASGGGRTTQLSQPFELMPGTYILSGKNLNIQDYVMYIERVSDNSILGNSQNGAFTIQQKTNVYLGINAISGKVYSTTFYPQLEYGSTATSYVPHTDLGPIYGGTLDLATGELIVDRASVDLGTLTWEYYNSYEIFVSSLSGIKGVDPAKIPNAISSVFVAGSWSSVATDVTKNGMFCFLPDYNQIRFRDTAYTDASTFKTAMSGVQLVYELATPITYHLTLQQITTLLGTNNIWVEGKNVQCTYYINSDVTAQLTALNSRLKNNYISKPFGTTKGDIIYYSDNSTSNRLGIGNEGQVLKVNASGLPSWSNDNNTNTTYTFTGGTNQFTATSSDGATQTVNVTPQVPNASTSSAGIVQLSTATNSTSTTQAATPSAVKSAYDLAASKTNNTGTVTSVTLTAGNGISITDNSVPITTIGGRTITNTGVTSVSQGTTNGTINVTTNGSTSAVAIRGLGSAAYTASTVYATAAQGGKADAAMPKSGGTFTGAVTLHSDPTTNLMAATKQYVDNNVSISDNISSGTKIATITINGVNTDLYSPGTPQTISVTQSSSTPTLEFITSTNSSNSSTLTGVTTTTLADGKMIVYRLAYALTGSPVTLTLSNTSGTSLGSYPVYIDGTTQCSDIYSAGTMLFLVFYNNKFTIVNPFGLAG